MSDGGTGGQGSTTEAHVQKREKNRTDDKTPLVVESLSFRSTETP